MNPVEAFARLLSDFRRYTHLQLTWLDVRRVLDEAEAMLRSYEQIRYFDDDRFDRFAMVLRESAKASLADCTDEYLWQRLRDRVEQGDVMGVAQISLLLWDRTTIASIRPDDIGDQTATNHPSTVQ